MTNDDDMRDWIGREEVAVDDLTVDLARRFMATFDLPGTLDRGDPAPPLIHFCLAQPSAATSQLGEDGHPSRGGFLPPIALERRMWAGGRIRFLHNLRIGQTITRRSRIADIAMKAGRSGPLCFVTVNHEIEADGIVAISEDQSIVYRSGETRTSMSVDGLPEDAFLKGTIWPDSTLLFRYSALTFNGHRIHYDRRYAMEVEGYADLVVHGPLQATLLVNLACTMAGGRTPDAFEFRSTTPLFQGDGIELRASSITDGATRLWTARQNGGVAMQAEARWR